MKIQDNLMFFPLANQIDIKVYNKKVFYNSFFKYFYPKYSWHSP